MDFVDLPCPTEDQASEHAKVFENDQYAAYACWYPQMGGYIAKAIAIFDKSWKEDANGSRQGGCIDVRIWHDGEFPFAGDAKDAMGNPLKPVQLHHCDPMQFVRFGEWLGRTNYEWKERSYETAPIEKEGLLDKVGTRRLVLYVKNMITDIVAEFMFEPNDKDTWNKIGTKVTNFMQGLQDRQALRDFRVQCDEHTTTPTMSMEGKFGLYVFFRRRLDEGFLQLKFVMEPHAVNMDETEL